MPFGGATLAASPALTPLPGGTAPLGSMEPGFRP